MFLKGVVRRALQCPVSSPRSALAWTQSRSVPSCILPLVGGVGLTRRAKSSLSSLGYTHAAPDPLSDPAVFEEVDIFSQKKQTGVSLKTLLDTGKY